MINTPISSDKSGQPSDPLLKNLQQAGETLLPYKKRFKSGYIHIDAKEFLSFVSTDNTNVPAPVIKISFKDQEKEDDMQTGVDQTELLTLIKSKLPKAISSETFGSERLFISANAQQKQADLNAVYSACQNVIDMYKPKSGREL